MTFGRKTCGLPICIKNQRGFSVFVLLMIVGQTLGSMAWAYPTVFTAQAENRTITTPPIAVSTPNVPVVRQSTVSKTVPSPSSVYNSLLGFSLLTLAYEKDALLKKFVQKKGYIGPGLAVGLTAIYGLTLSQGIYGVNTSRMPIPLTVSEIRKRILVPYTLNIILAGVGLFTFASTSWWTARYDRKIRVRQQELLTRTEDILKKLHQGAKNQAVMGELTLLVGSEAADEFLKLWRKGHP